jgi:hypothetical protein
VSNDDLPGTLDALKSDGTLVQTVIGVLDGRAILRRAAGDVDVQLSSEYGVDASAKPGSTLIDVTLTGPDRSVLGRLAPGYASEASTYVTSSYSAYVLERLSTAAASDGGGPATGEVIVLALLLGAVLGVALVAAEVRLAPELTPRTRTRSRRTPSKPAERQRRPRVYREPRPDAPNGSQPAAREPREAERSEPEPSPAQPEPSGADGKPEEPSRADGDPAVSPTSNPVSRSEPQRTPSRPSDPVGRERRESWLRPPTRPDPGRRPDPAPAPQGPPPPARDEDED